MTTEGYKKPTQDRAIKSEQRFLEAFGALLNQKSYHDTTVQEIAGAADLTPSAFMARFGSKREGLSRLFELFCDDVHAALDVLGSTASGDQTLHALIKAFSTQYETLVQAHWGANRAMHEIFLNEGVIDRQTRAIFKATVSTLHQVLHQKLHLDLASSSIFSTVQLLVTINYNYVLGAMPGLPDRSDERQDLIAHLLVTSLNQP